MYNLLVMQFVVSAVIVGYILMKVSYVTLNRYFHPPYQQVLKKQDWWLVGGIGLQLRTKSDVGTQAGGTNGWE